ncbi:MAG: dienelactone hydrolase family protein [Devosia sp.]|nr:dienelactone hydrolase family protein [Devosia sp.]
MSNRADESPKITREMINLFDDYTHLSLDRRRFMDHLAKLAGSMSAATVAAAMMASNSKAAGLVAENDARLVLGDISYPGARGDMQGYLAHPVAGGPFGAVIVVHENRGLNAHIRDVTRRVALEGYLALAPDFLSDLGGTPTDEEAARPMFQTLSATDVAANGVATVTFLAGHEKSNGKVGAMGFCWGGGTVNNLAVAAPDLRAAVPYYGGQPNPEAVPAIKARLMAHYGGLDERINAGIPAFEAALKAAGVDYQIFIYEGANHAFNNDTSEARYDKQAADLAWSRTMELFRETLG